MNNESSNECLFKKHLLMLGEEILRLVTSYCIRLFNDELMWFYRLFGGWFFYLVCVHVFVYLFGFGFGNESDIEVVLAK